MIALPLNENEYDDDRFGMGSMKLISAVQELWDAGASQNDIENEFENALENIDT